MGACRKNKEKKIKSWMDNQHLARWRGLSSAQGQAQQLISGCSPAAETKIFTFIRIQSRVVVVVGLLTRHNTPRRHLHLKGQTNIPLSRRCGAEYETSAHTLCECEDLASLKHVCLGFFLDPEDMKSLSLGDN